jgi:hypothetical protein
MPQLRLDGGMGVTTTVDYPVWQGEWLWYAALALFTCLCICMVYSVAACAGLIYGRSLYAGAEDETETGELYEEKQEVI